MKKISTTTCYYFYNQSYCYYSRTKYIVSTIIFGLLNVLLFCKVNLTKSIQRRAKILWSDVQRQADVSMCVDPALPLVHSVALFLKGFPPSHHSRMDWDYAAVNQEG